MRGAWLILFLSACSPEPAETAHGSLCPEVAPGPGQRLLLTKPLSDPDNALFFARMARLSYEDGAALDREACTYGFEQHFFFQTDLGDREEARRGETGDDIPDAEGFVALVRPADAPEARAVVIAYRGTDSTDDLVDDLDATQAMPGVFGQGGEGRVHEGFLLQARALWERIEAQVWELVLTPEGRALAGDEEGLRRCLREPDACPGGSFDRNFWPVFFTGHSLGGAVAAVAASRVTSPKSDEEVLHLVRDFGAPVPPATRGFPIGGVITFGQPRMGNGAFVARFHEHLRQSTHTLRAGAGEPYVRIGNEEDFVPLTPTWFMGYRHGGRMVWYDQDWSGLDVTCSDWKDSFWGSVGDFSGVVFSNWGDVLRARDHSIDSYVATLEEAQRRGLRCP